MRKYLFYIFMALVCAACILDGCKKEELQEGSGPAPVITVREGEKVYPGKGGAFSLLYSIENPREGVKPELSSGESWIRDLAAGEGRITFTLDQNPSSTESRKGNIGISYKGAEPVSVEITQAGMDQAVITVKDPEVFGCEGGSGTIMYSIENPREGVGPEVSCEESWISGLSAGEGRITFTLSVNESVKSRKGTIIISYMEAEPVSVEITQAGQEQSVIKVENPEAEFDYNGGSGSVKYSIEKPRDGDKLQATCSDSWITGITVGSGSISFKVSKNTDEAERTGEIELTYGNAEPAKIVVKQQEFIPAVIETSSNINVDAWGGVKKTITYSIINPRPGAKLTAKSETSWIRDIVVGDGEVTFSKTFNFNGSSRTGKIVLEYEDAEPVTVTVTQNAWSGGPVSSLGVSESANCYIVTKPGVYKMPAVKGNDKSQKVSAASVEVLWETRKDEKAKIGDIVNLTVYDNGNIYFNVKGKTSTKVPEGNALIAAKDASGNILWSWHIWVTSVMPKDQVYKNGAGTMMECDLGAACVESDAYPWSSGLYYQYGRKDPFWGDHSCTLDGWKKVESDATTGNMSYADAHPTTFLCSTRHWLYNAETGLWRRNKSISDPCPPGYVVPDGGQYGVWARASGTTESTGYKDCSSYFVDNGSGSDLEFRSSGECYYRPNGYIECETGYLSIKKLDSSYWSLTSFSTSFYKYVYVYNIDIYNGSTGLRYAARPTSNTNLLGEGNLVRCMKKTW